MSHMSLQTAPHAPIDAGSSFTKVSHLGPRTAANSVVAWHGPMSLPCRAKLLAACCPIEVRNRYNYAVGQLERATLREKKSNPVFTNVESWCGVGEAHTTAIFKITHSSED